MAAWGGETLSDEIITLKCNVCALQNKTRDAEKYCTECQEYYCIPCSDMHKMFAMFKEHNLLTKEDFHEGVNLGSLPHIPTERCTKHTFRVLDMFCEDHDVTCCASCLVDHRLCSSIHSIPNELDTLYPQQLLDEMKNKLQTATKEIEDVAAAKRITLEELEQSEDKALEAVKTFRKEIDTFFNNLEKSLKQEIESRFKTIETEIKTHISETEKLVENLRDASVKLQSSEGNRAQEFVSTKSAEKDIDKSRRALDSILKYEVKRIDFEPNSEIRKLFQQIKSLGTIVEMKQKQHSNQIKTSAYKIKRQSQINVNIQGDPRECVVSGACMTDSGLLLLADYYNDKLKRLNLSSKTIRDFIHLLDPQDVCVVSSSEAAVCLWNQLGENGSVQFVTLGDQMSASRSFKLDRPGMGMAYQDGKLFISDDVSAVYTYDLAGKRLSKITTDALGRTIFSNCRQISISTLTNEVYVADTDKGVVKLDTQGKLLSTYSDLASTRPTAISTDGINVFVAGENSNSIMQIGSDGKIIGSFGDVALVESLYFDSKSNTLIVSEKERDFIKIYELQ